MTDTTTGVEPTNETITAPAGTSLMEGATPAPAHPDEHPDNPTVEVSVNPEEAEKTTVGAPEGIDPTWWDAENGVLKTEDMIKAYTEQRDLAAKHRKTISKGLKAPESMEEYKFAFDGKLADMDLGEGVEDAIRKVAFENGLTQDQALNTFNQFLNQMVDAGNIQAPKTEEQAEAERTAFLEAETAKFGTPQAFEEAKGALATFVERAQARGQFSETEADMVKSMVGGSAEAMKVGLKLVEMMGELQIPANVSVSSEGLPSDREIAQGMKDNKYSQSELENLFAQRKKAGRPDRLSAELF